MRRGFVYSKRIIYMSYKPIYPKVLYFYYITECNRWRISFGGLKSRVYEWTKTHNHTILHAIACIYKNTHNLGQVRYLIVSIPDLCTLTYFEIWSIDFKTRNLSCHLKLSIFYLDF